MKKIFIALLAFTIVATAIILLSPKAENPETENPESIIFTSSQYTEVTVLSRENWDETKLPEEVIKLENEGYTCYPMPLEFNADYTEVTLVEWTCEMN